MNSAIPKPKPPHIRADHVLADADSELERCLLAVTGTRTPGWAARRSGLVENTAAVTRLALACDGWLTALDGWLDAREASR